MFSFYTCRWLIILIYILSAISLEMCIGCCVQDMIFGLGWLRFEHLGYVMLDGVYVR